MSEYKYDKDGVLIEILQDNDSRQELKYDENGNIIEQCSYSLEGELNSKNTYTYH